MDNTSSHDRSHYFLYVTSTFSVLLFQPNINLALVFLAIRAKAEFAEEGTFFSQTDFLPWEFLLIKKLEIEKTKPTFVISVLKVQYLVGFVFSKSNFFINKISQGRKSVREKSTFSCKFSFNMHTFEYHSFILSKQH